MTSEINNQKLQTAARLSGALQIETTAEKGFSGGTFVKFHDYLEKTYSLVHQRLNRSVVKGASLMFHWKGKSGGAPLVLMGHMDVVPAENPDRWVHSPFSGYMDEQWIWGRGAIDDKHQIIFQLDAVEELLKQGFTPETDIWLCYGHDEETAEKGSGAEAMAGILTKSGVKPGLVLDEGGSVSPGTIFNNAQYFAFISLAEKGYMDIILTAEGQGGHSSIPHKDSSLSRVTAAARDAEGLKPDYRITPIVRELFKTIPGIEDDSQILPYLLATDMGRAMASTTTAFTMAKGSEAPNILPGISTAMLNCRLLPGDTAENMAERIKNAVQPYDVTITVKSAHEPTRISDWDSKESRLVRGIVSELFPDAPACPMMMLGGTDAKYYNNLCSNVLRFVPIKLSDEEKSRMHSVNERIPLEALDNGVNFYKLLLVRYGR